MIFLKSHVADMKGFIEKWRVAAPKKRGIKK
jgi:hypothetical protein